MLSLVSVGRFRVAGGSVGGLCLWKVVATFGYLWTVTFNGLGVINLADNIFNNFRISCPFLNLGKILN